MLFFRKFFSKSEPVIIYFIVIFIALFFISSRLDSPFDGHHDFNAVFYSQIARNYLRYGLVQTKGAQVINSGFAEKEEWDFHTHHPATYPMILAGAFGLLGVHEWVARILSFIASMIGILFLTKLINYRWIIIPITITPLFLFYSIMPVFEPILFPSIIIILIAFHKQNAKLLFFSSLFAIFIDWPGYWPPLWILMLEVFKKNRNFAIIKSVLASLIVGTIIILSHQLIISGFSLESLMNIGLYRANVLNEPYSYYDWLKLLVLRIKAFYGIPLVFTTVFGLIITIKEKSNSQLILLTFLISISHIVVFRNITWYHDYMLFYSLPFVAICTGVFLNWLKSISKNSVLAPLALIVFIFITFLSTNRFYKDLQTLRENESSAFINFYSDNYRR